jgi:hypothetical protein
MTFLGIHFAAAAATYLAAGREMNVSATADSDACPTGPPDACLAVNRETLAMHALAPLALCHLVTLVTHMPSLFLLSRVRAHHMQACLTRILLLLVQIGVTYVAFPLAPALTFALSLHFACFFLNLGPVSRAPLIGDDMDYALRSLCIAGLLLACWRHGPPLPFRDVFGYAGACGAQAHLLGLFYASMVCPLMRAAAKRLLQTQ